MQAVSGTDAVSRTYGDGWTCGDDDRVRSYLGEDNPAAKRVRAAAREHIGLPWPTNSTLVTFGCK
jgi:hypothetical protein